MLSTDAADQLVPMPGTEPAARVYPPLAALLEARAIHEVRAAIPPHLNSALNFHGTISPARSGALYWEGNSTGMLLRGLVHGSGRIGYLSLSGQILSDEERKRYE